MKVEIEDWSSFIVTTLGAFGGWALVVATLTHYLGDMFAKRALQREASKLSEQLSGFAHELKLRESSYSKHLDLLLDYYSVFYGHYRRCQYATNQDLIRYPDGTEIKTRQVFRDQLEQYLADAKANEGKLRLVLPASLMLLNEEAIDAFNGFKDVMKREEYDEVFHAQKREAFAKIQRLKERIESGLREFLRTEELLRLRE